MPLTQITRVKIISYIGFVKGDVSPNQTFSSLGYLYVYSYSVKSGRKREEDLYGHNLKMAYHRLNLLFKLLLNYNRSRPKK